jgi:hypothetical protein
LSSSLNNTTQLRWKACQSLGFGISCAERPTKGTLALGPAEPCTSPDNPCDNCLLGVTRQSFQLLTGDNWQPSRSKTRYCRMTFESRTQHNK